MLADVYGSSRFSLQRRGAGDRPGPRGTVSASSRTADHALRQHVGSPLFVAGVTILALLATITLLNALSVIDTTGAAERLVATVPVDTAVQRIDAAAAVPPASPVTNPMDTTVQRIDTAAAVPPAPPVTDPMDTAGQRMDLAAAVPPASPVTDPLDAAGQPIDAPAAVPPAATAPTAAS